MLQKSRIFALFLLSGSLSLLCTQAGRSQSPPAPSDAIRQHMQAAQQHMRDKRPDLAIPEFEAAIALDPANVDAQANLGVLLYFGGEYGKAVPHLAIAVKAQPDLWKIQALLGLAEYRLKDAAHARADLASALPHLQGEKVQDEAGEALIESYSASGELDKAGSVVAVLLESKPTDPRLLALSYRIYSDLASNAILTMALAAPHSAEMHQIMARELTRHGDEAAAIANYREAIRIDPKMPGLYFELGSVLYDSNDEKLQSEAETQFQAALAADPRDEKSQLMLGKIASRRGDLEAAYAADSRAVELAPNDPEACTELAKILMSRNEPEKARALLTHAIAVDATDYTAYYRLSSLDRQQGKPEEAKAELAEYQKYKAMKDKLRDLLHEMRMNVGAKPEDAGGMEK